MNKDIAAEKEEQIKGAVKEQWGRLTDDELTKVAGKREKAPWAPSRALRVLR